jgi:hypothetical protein
MVERPEEQCGIARCVGFVKPPGVADGSGERVVGLRGSGCCSLLDVQGQRVDEVDPVAGVRKPGGIDAGATPYVEDIRRGWREIALQELLSADQFERAASPGEALALSTPLVVSAHIAIDHARLPRLQSTAN